MWSLIVLLLTSGDVVPLFQSQGGSARLCASPLACNGFLRFTSGATPADLCCCVSNNKNVLRYLHLEDFSLLFHSSHFFRNDNHYNDDYNNNDN